MDECITCGGKLPDLEDQWPVGNAGVACSPEHAREATAALNEERMEAERVRTTEAPDEAATGPELTR